LSRQRRRKGRAINGIVVLDKPKGMSSNAALQAVKRIFDANKAGHTGSLDPLATGVLPLCLGEATKVSQFLLDSNKRYQTKIKLGVRTDSGDAEGSVISSCDKVDVSLSQVKKVLSRFKGEIEQLPPMYSALKVNGVPLYKLARKGQTIERKTRLVTVFNIDLVEYDSPFIELEIFCSKGTYIRTIADDIGEALGCGAHIVELRRLQAGCFDLQESVTLKQLESEREEFGLEAIDDLLIEADRAVEDLPEVILPAVSANCIKQGQAVLARHLPADGLVRLYEEDQFIGIGSIDEDGRVAPRRLIVN
jgi:tRNA pseudouridine55 synthase